MRQSTMHRVRPVALKNAILSLGVASARQKGQVSAMLMRQMAGVSL